jgi:hypothetical protein
MSVADDRSEFLQLDDYLVARARRQLSVDGIERAVELRACHRVKEIGMVRGHLSAEYH